MNRLAPAVIAALMALTACNSSEAAAPDPIGIGISCGEDIENIENRVRFASPEHAWELPPEERAHCGGFWVGDYPDAARQHEYIDLEREALEVANIQNHLLPGLYGRCAASHLGYDGDM